ncbi:MAG: M1 family metallopeptidase [Acidimicrobiia bacterium]|nr:M1 family metallopeptidase [Acidimicrobiia bacterium]
MNPHRLPRTAVPSAYDLDLVPDLEAGVFEGEVTIHFSLSEATRSIVLNAAELDISSARVGSPGGDRYAIGNVTTDPERERVTVELDSELEAGDHRLELAFTGVLNDRLCGFYRSVYEDGEGVRHTLATTQFEATDARRAFPCFDEPDFKARFRITLDIPEALAAYSNSAAVSEAPSERRGRKVVRFAETMPMSTYLVAFVVGNLDATAPVDVDGTALRVVHAPGKAHLAAFGLEIGAFSLRYFSDYYGIPYPADKLDLLAIPDFAAGAMENLGCVTFREALLLVDPATSTQGELTRIADVVAHEIAHMWFGDLVTMGWWNGLWLNEAFATFMEVSAVAVFRPEWERWNQFALERSAAFDVDALRSTRPIEYPVESPEDAEGMFDILTYEKGASVLRMLEQYLGADRFRDGIRRYLREHEYGNTETTDLFDAIEAESGEPIRRMMDGWIFQGGFPLVRADLHDTSLELTQSRMLYGEAETPERWEVPVLVDLHPGTPDVPGARAGVRTERALLGDVSVRIDLEDGDLPVVNAGGHGFYRVHRDGRLLALTTARLADLDPIERYAVVDDAWASVLAGEEEVAEFLRLLGAYAECADLDVWRLIAACVAGVDRLVDGSARDAFRHLVRSLFAVNMGRLGWQVGGDEPAVTRQLRGVVIRALGTTGGDDAVHARAVEVHAAYLADAHAVSGDVAAAAAAVVAHRGDATDWDTFVQRSKEAPTPQEQIRYLQALVDFPHEAEYRRTLAYVMSDEVRTQDAPFVLAGLVGHREHGPIGWELLTREWDAINARFPSNTIVRLVSGVRALGLSHPELAPEVHAFFADHDIPQARRTLAQHLEKLDVNVALREREAARLGEMLVAVAEDR